jgi:hydroxypyruvate isomerase
MEPMAPMERRAFLRRGATAAGALAVGGAAFGNPASAAQPLPAARPGDAQPARAFRLRYAPHFGMFRQSAGADVVDQLRFMAGQGFRALEDNGMRGRPVAEQERIGREMERLGMAMGVFVAHTIHWTEPSLTSGDQARRDQFLAEVRESVDVAKRVRAKWMTVVPGYVHPRLEMSYQTAHVIESLKRASAILEPHGLAMVLEPLNTLRNHPGMFLTKVPQTYMICKAVGSPSCKILFDMYHQQITEGNLIPNIDLAWDEVAYFQIGDNPGRNEPTTGEINYRNIFRHIHGKGYQGILGMEHGNSRPGQEGEAAVIAAYRAVDDF